MSELPGAVARAAAVVYVCDVARVVPFYATISDLAVADVQDGFTVLRSSTLELALVSVPPGIADDIEITDPPQRREDTAVKLVLPVASLAAARIVAPALRGIVDSVDTEWLWQGTWGCDGHDPEGNVVHLQEIAPR